MGPQLSSKPFYVFVHKDFPVDTDGVNSGAETATLWLVRTLARLGHRVVLAAQLKRPECTKWGVEFWDLGASYDVPAIIHRAATDASGASFRLFAACRAWPLVLGKQTSRCISTHLMAHDPSAGALGIAPKILSHYADSVFCVSHAQAELFIKEGCPADLITVLGNGADRGVFAPAPFAQRDLNKIVFAGALVVDKGIDLLIKAYARVRSMNPQASLDIYGSSSMWGREPLFDQKQLESQLPGLKFHGAVAQETVAHALQTCALSAIPSRWFDSFPLSAVEAESTGCPVVAFDVGGMREAIADGISGRIIPAVSDEELAKAFTELLGNRSELERLSRGAAQLVTERFDWQMIAAKLLAVVEQQNQLQNSDATPSQSDRSAARATEGQVCVISTWNQHCGLATYGEYLWGQAAVAGKAIVLSEQGVDQLSAIDPAYVRRCWTRSDLSGVTEQLRLINPAIIHLNLHSVDFLPVTQLVSVLTTQKRSGARIVAHLHSTFAARPAFQELKELVDLFIVHAEQNRLELLAQGARDVAVLPHGIAQAQPIDSQQRDAVRKSFNVTHQESLLVSFGFIQPHKGTESLIEAVATLRSAGIPARGVVLGAVNKADPNAAQYRAALEQFAHAKQVHPFITFTDEFASNERVVEVLQASDLVVMNYQSQHFEASGATAIALGAGATIISSLAPMFNDFGAATWRATAGFPVARAAQFLLSPAGAAARCAMAAARNTIVAALEWPNIWNRLQEIYQVRFGVQLTTAQTAPIAAKSDQIGTPIAQSPANVVPSLVGANSIRMGRLKILFQNRPNTFTQRGGDTIVLERVVAGLRALGHECVVDVECRLSPQGFDIVHLFNFALPDFTRILAQRAVQAGVPYVVTTLNEDLPNFHAQSLAAGSALLEYVRRGQRPADWQILRQTFDGTLPITPSPAFDNTWVAEHAGALLTNGRRESESIRRQYRGLPAERVIEVPLGFEVTAEGTSESMSAEQFCAEYGVKDFVLCVGRLETRKNQLMLLKALEHDDITVVFASGGFTYQPEYAEAVRRFRRVGKTLVLERLDPAVLAAAYKAAKVHVLASWYELPGLVSLEAGALGCNVVASDRGTARDYLGDLAGYCDPGDERSIRDAVLVAIKRSRPLALMQHLTQYRWARCAQETEAVYQAVIRRSRGIAVEVVQEKEVPAAPKSSSSSGNAEEVSIQQQRSFEVGSSEVNSNQTQEGGMSAMTTYMQQQAGLNGRSGMISPAVGSYDMSSESTEFMALLEKGELEAKNMRLAEAHTLLEQAEMMNPSSVRLMKARGTVFLAENKNEIAAHYFERAHRSDPKDARILVGLGMLEIRRKEIRKAQELFANALRLAPDSDVALLQLIGTSYELGEFADLERCLRQYLHLKPENMEMQYCLAGCLLKTNQLAESESIAVGILKRNPEHKHAKELLTIIHEKHQINTQAAIATVVSTPIAANRSVDIDTMLGNLEEHKRRKEYPELRQGLNVLLKRTDMVADQEELALCLSAEMMVVEDDLTGAEQMFQQVLAMNPNSPRGLCGKAVLKAHLNQWIEAQNLFERARSLKPNYDLALAGLGICALQANDQEVAWARFIAALQNNPENTRALLGLVQLAYPMKRFPELESAIRAYLDIHSADLDWVYSLAGVCFAQGKLSEAKEAVEQIKLFKPNDPRAMELDQMIAQRA